MITSSNNTNIDTYDVKAAKFVECFEPMPIIGRLDADCWGADCVGSRDQDNGLEDRDIMFFRLYCPGMIHYIMKDTATRYVFPIRIKDTDTQGTAPQMEQSISQKI